MISIIPNGAAALVNVAKSAFFLFLAIVVLRTCASAADRVGMVTSLTGTARLNRGSQEMPVTVSIAVLLKDEIITAPASQVTVELDDGSKLDIGGSDSTAIVIDQHFLTQRTTAASNAYSTFIKLLYGSLRSTAKYRPGGRFQVLTPNAIVGTRGTVFEVSVSQGRARPGFSGCGLYTDVQVYSGIVAVSAINNPSSAVEVQAGSATTVPCFSGPLSPGPLGLAGKVGGVAASAAAPPPACPPCPMIGPR